MVGRAFATASPILTGYLILSAVGFNSDKTIALVYVEHRLSADAAGARSAAHSGAIRGGLRPAALGTEAGRTGRQKREETRSP
jgi:hypothetical protein